MLKLKIILLICLCAGHLLRAQYQFRNIDVQDGLSHNTVNCFCQDSVGFIWMGTEAGLNRYDGHHIRSYYKIFEDTLSLTNNLIYELYCDSRGRVWIATDVGLNRYDHTTDRFTQYLSYVAEPHRVIHNLVYTICEDARGNIWAGTIGGLTVYSQERVRHIALHQAFPLTDGCQKIHSIVQGDSGNMWLGTRGGLILYNAHKDTFIQRIPVFSNARLLNKPIIKLVRNNRVLWIRTMDKMLYKYDMDANRIENIFLAGEDQRRPDIVSLDNMYRAGIGIGYNAGFYLYKTKLQHYANTLGNVQGLEDYTIISMTRDIQGNIWLGTRKNGAYIASPHRQLFACYRHHPGLNSPSDNVINALAEDAFGRVWIGTDRGGLNRFDPVKRRFSHFIKSDDPVPNPVTAVMCDSRGHIWVGFASDGLYRFDAKTSRFLSCAHIFEENSMPSIIRTLVEDHQGRIWIGSFDGVLQVYDPHLDKARPYTQVIESDHPLSHRIVNAILEDRDQNLWFGCAFGLNCYIREQKRMLRYFDFEQEGLTGNKILSLYEDSQGRIWVGTKNGGLNLFQNNRFRHFTTGDGLPGDAIYGILEDNSGYLWISTSNGLSRFRPDDSTGIKVELMNFTQHDGLQSNQFIQQSCLKISSGHMLFGGVAGFNFFHPDDITMAFDPVEVVLTNFSIFNQPVVAGPGSVLQNHISRTEKIVLNHRQNMFSLSFIAFDYYSPQRIRYAYRMDGFDSDWNYMGAQNRATYTNLNAGNYQFRVKASRNDLSWESPETLLQFRILPPPWKTGLAYFLYLFILGIAFYLIYLYIRMKRQLQLERVESDKRHYMDNMRLRFFTDITHEFRTPLTLIIAPVEKLLISKSNQQELPKILPSVLHHAKRLLHLINQILDYRKLEAGIVDISIKQGDLVVFIRKILHAFAYYADENQVKLHFNTDLDSLITGFDRDKIEKILSNLISNAIKHSDHKGSVTVSLDKIKLDILNQEKFALRIVVADTGHGIPEEIIPRIFDRYYQMPAYKTSNSTGIGLALTKELVELLQGSIHVKSEVGKGSVFTLLFPCIESSQLQVTHPVDATDADWISTGQKVDEHVRKIIRKYFKEKPVILLADDDAGIRGFIGEELKDVFTIIEATNGLTGLNRARDLVPDLIISDVMMPELDGIQFCRQVKADERTSHIPVILLTALTAENTQISGYQYGADDYMTKPFSARILKTKIINLIENREKLKTRYSKSIFLEPQHIPITPPDEQFLKRAMDIAEANISNTSFNVNTLASDLCMSYMQLYRKLDGLLGQTPSQFVQSIRLKRAAQLLKENQHSVAEIAFSVGFEDPPYFTRSFKKLFGQTPSQYIKSS